MNQSFVLQTTEDWLPLEKNLVAAVRENPIIYQDLLITTKQYKASKNAAWDKIAYELQTPESKIKPKWTDIKARYAKLMKIIHAKRAHRSCISNHAKTKKFFNGLLSFMDDYIDVPTNKDIPPYIHNYYNLIFQPELTRALMQKVRETENYKIKEKNHKTLLSTEDSKAMCIIVERLLANLSKQKNEIGENALNYKYVLHVNGNHTYNTSVVVAEPNDEAQRVIARLNDIVSTGYTGKDLAESLIFNLPEDEQKMVYDKIAMRLNQAERPFDG